MRRGLWWSALILLVFVAVVLARLPARWLTAKLPAELRCDDPGGTIWHGDCASLALRGQPLGSVAWVIHPQGLLLAHIDAQLQLSGPKLTGSSAVTLGRSGDLTLRDLKIGVDLPTPLIPRLAPDLSGHVQADLSELQIASGWIRDIRGRIECDQLFSGGPQSASLGNFELRFTDPPHSGQTVGQLHDLGGPLDVQGTLTLGATPGYLLEGSVAARPQASEVLRNLLARLGAADATGHHRFAQEAEL